MDSLGQLGGDRRADGTNLVDRVPLGGTGQGTTLRDSPGRGVDPSAR